MKKEKGRNNRLLYSLISLGILVFVVGGVYAAINPATDAYHLADKIDFSNGLTVVDTVNSVGASFLSGGAVNPLNIIGGTNVGGYWRENFVGTNIALDTITGKPKTITNGYKGSAIGFNDDSAQGNIHFFTAAGSTAGTVLSERMTIDSSGKVGIGTTTPGYNLQVEGSINADEFLYDSDISLKENILPLSNSLSKIKKLQGVSFNWKDVEREDIGLIAQDVEKVYPEIVHTSKDGLKSVEYGNLVAVLIEAVKEQQKQIDSLQKEISELKSQLKN